MKKEYEDNQIASYLDHKEALNSDHLTELEKKIITILKDDLPSHENWGHQSWELCKIRDFTKAIVNTVNKAKKEYSGENPSQRTRDTLLSNLLKSIDALKEDEAVLLSLLKEEPWCPDIDVPNLPMADKTALFENVGATEATHKNSNLLILLNEVERRLRSIEKTHQDAGKGPKPKIWVHNLIDNINWIYQRYLGEHPPSTLKAKSKYIRIIQLALKEVDPSKDYDSKTVAKLVRNNRKDN